MVLKKKGFKKKKRKKNKYHHKILREGKNVPCIKILFSHTHTKSSVEDRMEIGSD